jgi:hypothetical protein
VKKILASVLIFLSANTLYSLANTPAELSGLPVTSAYVSEGVYIATRVALRADTTSALIISSGAILHNVVINNYGSFNSRAEVFNVKFTTKDTGTSNMYFNIDTSSETVWGGGPLNVYFSSGIALSLTGSTIGDVTVIYRKK